MKIRILIKNKEKQTKTLHSSLYSVLPITSSFILVALGAAVYHSVDPFVPTAFLANVPSVMCEPLVHHQY